MMSRAAAIAYGLFAYLAFVASFVVFGAAAAGPFPPLPSVDGVPDWPAWAALALDLALVLAFGLQHTIMARRRFKERLARILPAHLERSTFVLASAICLGAIALFWRPIGGDLWAAHGAPAVALRGLALGGFGLALIASFALDHFQLFGLRQTLQPASASVSPPFSLPPLYRVVRHPMMLGILVGVWATPRLTVGHAVFAASLTAYILVGVAFEERELIREFGRRYAAYRAEVPMLIPWLVRRRDPATIPPEPRSAPNESIQ